MKTPTPVLKQLKMNFVGDKNDDFNMNVKAMFEGQVRAESIEREQKC